MTDANGTYRFPSLAPGTYTVKFELSSFKTVTQEARLQLGQSIAVDSKLEVGGLQEAITILGEAPIVDVKSSAAQKNLTSDVLEYVPFTNRFGPGAMLMAPGVNPNNYSSYGSGGSSSNAYMVDGVDVSDPEGGTIWLFANYNWIQEVQVIGLGANAEYGGFTGVASNSLFRSGSNVFHGLFETLYENDGMTGSNTSDALLEENPSLRSGTTDYVTDTTFQIGGPIKRDKLWFFTSFQVLQTEDGPGRLSADASRAVHGHRHRARRTARGVPTIPVQADGEDWSERSVDGLLRSRQLHRGRQGRRRAQRDRSHRAPGFPGIELERQLHQSDLQLGRF